MDPILSSELTGSGVAGGLSSIPRTMDPNSPYNPGFKRGKTSEGAILIPPEPDTYPGQRIWR
jgi:hypothetical protein